ncbi:MAG: hypothetical protein JXM79_08670 [Sedimentisphaerales bacterium]|nr:hypothetical protein [Sedimentisphaerales bacterium]
MKSITCIFLIECTILFAPAEPVLGSLSENDTIANMRIVHFPEDRSVGKIIHEIDEKSGPRSRKSYDAQGDVLLPLNTKLKFFAGSSLPESVLRESLVDLDLIELNLYEADISDQDFAYIAELKSVERIDSICNPITDKGLEHLASMPNLRVLHLLGSEITDEVVTFRKKAAS